MKILTSTFAFFTLVLATIFFPGGTPQPSSTGAVQASDKLVYADFDTMKDGRPVSARGGWVQLQHGEEKPGNPAKFTGIPGTNDAPELVRLKADDPNKAATFGYTLSSPNQYASVTLGIHGLPDKDGKSVADDVSGYKNLTFQIYAKGTPAPTGVQAMRVELISHGQGISLQWGFPQAGFKLNPSGFNTYKIPLKSMAQPSYAPDRVDLKDVLKKLTEVQISVYCENGCAPITGQVVIDNVVFTNN